MNTPESVDRYSVSVVMPNYNHARFLPHSLGGYLRQTRPPDEILVVDDGSTDDSLALLRDYEQRYPSVRVLTNPKNMGLSFTVARIFSEARCDFIYPAAADDVPEPGLLEALVGLAERYPQTDIVTTNVFFSVPDPSGERPPARRASSIRLTPEPAYLAPAELAEAVRSITVPALGFPLLRRAALEKRGGYCVDLDWYDDMVNSMIAGFRSGLCHSPAAGVGVHVDADTYSWQGRANARRDRQALQKVMRCFLQPRHRDILPLVFRSQMLCLFGGRALWAALEDPACRPFVPSLLHPKTARYLARDAVASLYRCLPESWRRAYRAWRAGSSEG